MQKREQQVVSSQQFRIITQYGDMLVIKQAIQMQPQPQQAQESPSGGQQHQHQTRPVIMTFHDLGLNSELQFSGFCECDEVKLMLQTFTMLHVNFIGQEPQGQRLASDFRYPSVEQLAECIVDVCVHLRVRSFIALAVGAGAHIASLVALQRPDLVDGLFLINPIASSCSITEWLYFKMSAIASNQHFSSALSQSTEDHHLEAPAGSAGKGSSLRKLIAAATHIHLPHHHHHSHSQLKRRNSSESSDLQTCGDNSGSDATSIASGLSLDQQSLREGTPAQNVGAASSRLRRLILSRNFRLTGHPEARRNGSKNQAEQTSGSPCTGQQQPRKLSHESNSSGDSSKSQQQQGCKRPPLEYLMYHHFGSTSFQRCSRRGSGDSLQEGSPVTSKSSASGPSKALKATRSHESLEVAPSVPAGDERSNNNEIKPRERSGSLCLSSAYLASLASERQRSAHMQMAYKHHFGQPNSHNLWLFAHSFVKRRSLSLRKDCGAAAHAAAAAAQLGTSICTAFVGAGVSPANLTIPTAAPQQQQQAQLHHHHHPQKFANKPTLDPPALDPTSERALVAGTKVKRTFACQTLIMCSSVGLHCERAFKLMSLLNPLQATCIKTQHMLVLEEKPEKVCQALRLFLQGIGYSMSTYERRLRLSSHTGSAGSNDSGGSLRSLEAASGNQRSDLA